MTYHIDYALQFMDLDPATTEVMDGSWERYRVYKTAQGAFKYAQRREANGFDVAFAYVPERGYTVWTNDDAGLGS